MPIPKMVESLTKEDFWNVIQKHAPQEMKRFCAWIDEYKKRVNWNYLFDPLWHEGEPHNDVKKFHDIPVAMQIGIFMQYVIENEHHQAIEFCTHDIDHFEEFPEMIREWFYFEEKCRNAK